MKNQETEETSQVTITNSAPLDQKTDNKNLLLLAGVALAFLLLKNSESKISLPKELKKDLERKVKENLEKLKLRLQKEQYKNLNEKFIGQSPDLELISGICGIQIGKNEQTKKETCSDCNGTRKIILLTSVVDCEKCK